MNHISSIDLPKILDIPLWNVMVDKKHADKLLAYGTLFIDFDQEVCRVEKWPTKGWRKVEDGLSGGDSVTTGSFSIYWKNGMHHAKNSAVTDGDYCFVWNNLESLLTEKQQSHFTTDGASKTESMYLFKEINYHACGSQLFYCEKHPIIILLAKTSSETSLDDVQARDFEAFLLPPGLGLNVHPFIWHAPPINPEPFKHVIVHTKQAKVHSKIYYDPLSEDNTVLRLKWPD